MANATKRFIRLLSKHAIPGLALSEPYIQSGRVPLGGKGSGGYMVSKKKKQVLVVSKEIYSEKGSFKQVEAPQKKYHQL